MKMIRNSMRVFLGVFTVLFFYGCSTLKTTIRPTDKENRYKVIATAAEEHEAVDGANKKAEEHCRKMGKTLLVKNSKTEDNSLLKSKHATKLGNRLSMAAGGGMIASSPEDYKVTMDIECK